MTAGCIIAAEARDIAVLHLEAAAMPTVGLSTGTESEGEGEKDGGGEIWGQHLVWGKRLKPTGDRTCVLVAGKAGAIGRVEEREKLGRGSAR